MLPYRLRQSLTEMLQFVLHWTTVGSGAEISEVNRERARKKSPEMNELGREHFETYRNFIEQILAKNELSEFSRKSENPLIFPSARSGIPPSGCTVVSHLIQALELSENHDFSLKVLELSGCLN